VKVNASLDSFFIFGQSVKPKESKLGVVKQKGELYGKG
jgi:hypothetical protein